MSTALRTNPLATALARASGTWGTHNDMPVLLTCATDRQASVALADASCLRRWGVKGSQAAGWLANQGLVTPALVNQWTGIDGNGVLCRLGSSEFLIEDGWHGVHSLRLSRACDYGIAGVYPVLRQDACLLLAGVRVDELLAQVCSYRFAVHPERPAAPEVVMTSMAGVGVTVIVQDLAGAPRYRIWCDCTYATYLWETLSGITSELGGSVAGIGDLLPEARDG